LDGLHDRPLYAEGRRRKTAFILACRIHLQRPLLAVALTMGVAANALIPNGLAQSDVENQAEMAEGPLTRPAKIDDGSGAAAARAKSATGRAEAADDANGSPSEPMNAAMATRNRALLILMLQNGQNRPFGSFK
jgi:hypothetical protein